MMCNRSPYMYIYIYTGIRWSYFTFFQDIYAAMFLNYSILLNIHKWFIQFQYFAPPPFLAGIVKFNYTTINKFFALKKT